MKDVIPALVKLADHLDKKGFSKEASFADEIIKKIHAYVKKAEEMPAEEKKPEDEESEEKEMMSPMKDEKEKDEEEAACMKADAKQIQLRQRARSRRLLLNKNS